MEAAMCTDLRATNTDKKKFFYPDSNCIRKEYAKRTRANHG